MTPSSHAKLLVWINAEAFDRAIGPDRHAACDKKGVGCCSRQTHRSPSSSKEETNSVSSLEEGHLCLTASQSLFPENSFFAVETNERQGRNLYCKGGILRK